MDNIGSALPEKIAVSRPGLFPYLFAFLFFVLSTAWTFLTNQVWDDDGITRFFLTQDAAVKPIYFLDSWVRPLFAVIFYWPIKLFGRLGLSLTMGSLITFSALMLYKGLKNKGLANAWAVIPFFLFGTFLFGIGRDAMTEPLAAIVISLGIYCLYSEKYVWFALIGALLPLARSETIFLMPFWAFPLLLKKKFFLIPLLGVGLLAWWLGWWMFTGNVSAFFHEIFKTSSSTNRYGHTALTHHMGKYIYVLGPVGFFYFTLGYLIRIKTILKDYFILLQFSVGFAVYVIFSSFLDLGQSGGALRNLITLSPFAAVIAVYGLNFWISLFNQSNSKTAHPVKGSKIKSNKQTPPVAATKGGKNRNLFIVFVIGLLIVAANFFTNKLKLRQSYEIAEKDYTIFLYLLTCAFIAIIPFLFKLKKFWIPTFTLFCLQITFTLFFERPQSHNNEERTAIGDLTNVIRTGSVKDAKVYTNHNWFFWSTGAVRADSSKYGYLDSINVRKVRPGEIVLWEPHYTGPKYTNIPIARFLNDSSYAPFYYVIDEKKQSRGVAFVKLTGNMQRDKDFFDRLVKEHTPNSRIYFLKGNFEKTREKNIQQAIKSYSSAIQLDQLFATAIFERAVSYVSINDITGACYDAKQAALLSHPNAAALVRKICGGQTNTSNILKIK